MKGWTLDDIPWRRFEAGKVDADLLAVARAAAIVEHNGADYGVYLRNVFAGDDAFVNAADVWAREEVRHGEALARWAAMADPSFDFEARFARFAAGYRLPLEARRSVRGSRSGELIARCVVEAATSSFYGALADNDDHVMGSVGHHFLPVVSGLGSGPTSGGPPVTAPTATAR